MNTYHKNLTKDDWAGKGLCEQMANIGSELSRMCNWLAKGNRDYYDKAMFRALELLDMTIDTSRGPGRKELCRLREELCGLWLEAEEKELRCLLRYFDSFAMAYALHRNKESNC